MDNLLKDLRYGLRMIWKSPGFAAIAVMSLALGIGANTALFSVVDAMLLKKLPVKEPDRLVLMASTAGRGFSPGNYTGNTRRDPVTGIGYMTSFLYQSFAQMREQESGLSDLFAFGNVNLNVNADGQADVASGQAVSGNYYAGLGVQALVGRTITDEDDRAGASPVAVISHKYWQRRFGADPEVVGKQVNLNNVAFTIVGVTQQGFDGTMQVGSTQDVSIPIAWEPQVATERSRMQGAGTWWLRLMGRLGPDATAEQVQASLEGMFIQTMLEHRAARQAQAQAQGQNAVPPLDPNDYPRFRVDPGSQGEMNVRQSYAPSLYLLLGVVGLVLLVACANVANLLLARATARQKEIAVRLALGASRWRLIRQLLTEAMLLATIGGALGVLLALWIKEGLLAVSDWGGSGMSELRVATDLRVLGFTLLLSLLTGLVFGIAPAWRATRIDLTPSLKDSGRGSSAASRSLLSKGLIVAQVAMSLLLLVGAGLLLRTLHNLQKVETGFNGQNLLLFSLDPGLIGYKGERLAELYRRLTERMEGVGGVRAVTFSRHALLSRSMGGRDAYVPGATAPADGGGPGRGIFLHQVRDNFLEAMEIPLLLGRPLSARDHERAPKVAVVNQTFARRFFTDENPIGKLFTFDSNKPADIEIVGLAQDAKYSSQRDEIPPTVYVPWLQELRALNSASFEVRTATDPASYVAAIREAVGEVDGNLPVGNVRTQVEQADQTLAQERLFAKLLSLFGLLAQQLASIGLYGVLAYSVSQRTHELGIRIALGASRGNVQWMILRQGMTLALIGVVLGLVGAYVLTKYLKSLNDMLYNVSATDPLVFGVSAVLLVAVALVACYLPARRATKVDPIVALRYE
jgi:predicted permease